MKTTQRGFIVPLLLIIAAILLAGGGAYFYTQTKSENSPVTENVTLPQATSTAPTSPASAKDVAKQVPFISSLSPSSGPGGTTVTINGSDLTQESVIYFDGGVVQNLQKYNGSPSFRVPSSVSNCPPGAYCIAGPQLIPPGPYTVQVVNANEKSNIVTFTVTSGKIVTIPVTASLTISANGNNPSHSVTVKVGDKVNYNWSR